jgi:autotransporter-associated beta strand protein
VTGNFSYPGTTTVDAGATLQVGNGGSTGNLGSGGIVVNGALVFDLANNVTISNAISGAGTNIQIGTGTLTLAASNTYSGPTIVSNGVLDLSFISSGTNTLDGDLDVDGGAVYLGPADAGSNITAVVEGNLNINGGAIAVNINKSLVQSNTLFSVFGAINSTGGTLRLFNFGPAVKVGDQFTIFNQPVTGGGSMTIESPGFTVANNLATSGSVTVTSVLATSTDVLTETQSSGLLNLSWPGTYTGLALQVQTNNSAANGLNTNGVWFSIPGTSVSNSYSIKIGTNSSVFYRLSPQ